LPTAQPRAGRIAVGNQSFAVYQESNYCPSPGFAAPVETAATTDSHDIAAGDFNNDGFPDLATVDTSGNQTGTLSTYMSNGGNGTFSRNTFPAGIGTLSSIVAADFNGDSISDLALHGSGKIGIYINNGTGAFPLTGSFDAPSGPFYTTLHTEDFNRDGKMDLIVGVGDRLQVFTGNGNGTFTTGFTQPLTGRASYSYAFGDLNGDGLTDAVVGQEQDFNVPRLVYFFGAANGTFTAGGTVALNLTPFGVKIADFNGDGSGDVVTNGVLGSQVQVFFWNPATNGFKAPLRVFSNPSNASIFDVADLDNDGKMDIVTTNNNFGGSQMTLIRGNGNGTFRLPLGFTSSAWINSFVFTDFNRDGKLDMAFAKKNNQMASQLAVCGSSATAAARAPISTRFDFDGDLKADFAVVRPADNTWYVSQGANKPWISRIFGLAEDIHVPADFDGDGKTDIAVFRPSEGRWYRLNSTDDSLAVFNWGKSGDVPAPADFDGDDRADLAVYRPGENLWYWLSSLNGQTHVVRFGLADDVPVVADYDADGRADIAVFRPSGGDWYWLNSSNGEFHSYHFGLNNDRAVPADYDGDGKTDFAVYRPSENVWYIMKSSRQEFSAVRFGAAGDMPSPADYDGDGKTDIAVFRNGVWYVLNSTAGELVVVQFGTTNDKPVPSLSIR
jgi:hypothetical protein